MANAEATSLLVKARRLVAVRSSNVTPSCLQARVAQGQPLPGVILVPVADRHEDARKFRSV